MKAEEILRKCGFKNAAAVSAAASHHQTVREIKLTAFAVKLVESKRPHNNNNNNIEVIRDKRRTLGIKPGVRVKGTRRAMSIAEALYEGSREEIYADSDCPPCEWGNGFPHYDARRRMGW